MTPSVGRPTTSGWRTAALALMAGAAVAATWAGAASPAQGAETCDGVWVVVDASEVGGELSVRCAEGDPDSGFAALTGAGHDYSFVPRIPGMVCTIDGRPDPCNGAPEDAYWSYWRAEEGGSWSYASRGAGDQDPQPGDVEGWAFGAGDPPGTAPPAPATDAEDDGGATDTSDGSRDADASDDGDAEPSGSDGGQAAGSSDGGDGEGSSAPQGDDTDDGTDGTDGDDVAGDDQGDDQDEGDDVASSTDRDRDADRDGPQVPRPTADDGTEGGERGDDPDDEDGTSRADDGSGEVEDADEVAIRGRSGGADWAGVAVGTTLAAALVGGAVLQGRRRRMEP